MSGSEGFDYSRAGDKVVITHKGKRATVLRGQAATRFLAEVEDADAQQLMARITGNYKRGNERLARRHQRNRQR